MSDADESALAASRPAALPTPAHRPFIVLDRTRATVIVTIAYAVAFVAGASLLEYVELLEPRTSGDMRFEQAMSMFMIVMLVVWLGSLFVIFRRERAPRLSRMSQ
ncbi:MAG: hypothetical protein AAGF11_16695 [Myxococcota bacterium]